MILWSQYVSLQYGRNYELNNTSILFEDIQYCDTKFQEAALNDTAVIPTWENCMTAILVLLVVRNLKKYKHGVAPKTVETCFPETAISGLEN